MKILKKISLGIFLLMFLIGSVYAQDENSGEMTTEAETAEAALEELEKIETPTGLTPEYPVTNPNIIYVEGENAVSTNFNREATLNFGCSGKRALQLNRAKGLQGGAPFFADFVFIVEEPGIYEFWYGGTPPGPEDELYPSYSSPFQFRLDNEEDSKEVFREDVNVVENYTPSYYWSRVGQLELTAGQHQIRFEITRRRGYDSRFYFYLDSFFFVRREGKERILGSPLPTFFPKDLDNRDLDTPFRSIDDYLIYIRDNPEDIVPLKELSLIYSLLSDYLNALKYLKRANIYDSYDEEVLLLMAKNKIWRGDIDGGLEGYSSLLGLNPEQADLWLEAGKVAAWVGLLEDSIQFLKRGIEYYPENLDLIVNLGLTHLWAGNKRLAEEAIQRAKVLAGKNPDKIRELADVFIVNGYPKNAIDILLTGIEENPNQIELYIKLQETYFNSGNKKASELVLAKIEKVFLPSTKLDQYLEVTETKLKEKETVLASYEAMLDESPDNLELREMLAQAYFWNGLKKEAIDEYLNILVNHSFQSLQNLEKSAQAVLKQIDRLYLFDAFFTNIESIFADKSRNLNGALVDYKKAVKAKETYDAKKAKAEAAGKEAPKAETDYQANIDSSQAAIAQFLGELKSILDQYSWASKTLLSDIENILELSKQDQKEKEAFDKIIKPIGWKWRRNLMLSELQRVESQGMALATHVLAKIGQYENQLEEASADFVQLKTQRDYPALDYAVYQSLLWKGSHKDAFDIYNAFAATIDEYIPYVSDVREVYEKTRLEDVAVKAVILDNPVTQVEEQINLAKTLLGQVKDYQKSIKESLDQVQNIMEAKMIRAFYQNQENTYLLRNELGTFYLSEGWRQQAIDQFQLVLDIDPWDINAIYQIGTVYEWNNQWIKAMENYKKVYWADPNYQNVTALYNNLARNHADQLNFQASYLSDTASITWTGDLNFKAEVNEILGLEANYTARDQKIFRYTENTNMNQTHSISLGLPLTLHSLNLSFTPTVGGTAYLTDNFYSTEASYVEVEKQVPVSDPGFDDSILNLFRFLGFYQIAPMVKAKLAMDFYPFVNLDITGAYDHIYNENLAYGRDKQVRDISAVLNVLLSFSSLDVPVLQDVYLRTHGELDYLLDIRVPYGSTMSYAFTAELGLKILEISEPSYINWSIFANVTHQNSTLDKTLLAGENPPVDYYLPFDVIVAGGGSGFSGYFPVAENNVFGINIQASGAYARQYETSAGAKAERLKISGDVNFEYGRGSTTLFLGGQFANLMNLATREWDYYSFYIKLGFVSRLANLLTP
ncbi:MAG: hypothetical protein JXR70_19910 [Spirochaetales bacterium]|nr:hypothetical protein [Spirochaetales bacterium]